MIGLVIFGDCAYVNGQFMVTPYKGARNGVDDDFNYFHSQLRITIERAFGMLVKRFGILRKAMTQSIPMAKKITIVMACCKLHNYVMAESGTSIIHFDPCLEVEDDAVINNEGRPEGLLDGGEHSDYYNENDVYSFGPTKTKRIELRRIVYESGKTRPPSSFHRRTDDVSM